MPQKKREPQPELRPPLAYPPLAALQPVGSELSLSLCRERFRFSNQLRVAYL